MSTCSATATCWVTETIAVQAEGQVIKRGILRDFPTSYTNKNGTHVEVAFDVQSVMRDGATRALPPSGSRTACGCGSAARTRSSIPVRMSS